jgi:hypothetical protein
MIFKIAARNNELQVTIYRQSKGAQKIADTVNIYVELTDF